jgi:lysophospholipase L1-like esterase
VVQVVEFVPGEVVAPGDPRVLLEGQWGHQPGVATTVNSGSRILFGFTGDRAQVLFDVEGLTSWPHIWISVDEGEPALRILAGPVVDLELERGRHRVLIAVKDVDEHANRWVPPFGSAVVFAGLVLGVGTRLEPTAVPAGPRVEFYGDSVTQGVRALGMATGPDGSDGTRSFAYLTARALGATAYQVGFGRQGVVRDGNGQVPAATESFGWNFAGSPAVRPSDPDVVVINLGVNDERMGGAYAAYLAKIRKAYAGTLVVALVPFIGAHRDEIGQAVAAQADPRIVVVDTDGWLGPEDYTDGVHPSVAGHAKAAVRLVGELSAIAGLAPV